MRNAIGLAASMASGISNNFGTITKPLHAGLAAQNVILAALMAKSGINASKDALEGPLGFFHAFGWAEKGDLDYIAQLGNPWVLEKPGVLNPKLYPCCHGVATNIELGILIRRKYQFSVGDVEEIKIHTQPKALSAMMSKRYLETGELLKWGYDGPPQQIVPAIPRNGKEAKFSKEYALARAIEHGKVEIKHFSDEAVNDPLIINWMQKIKVFHNSKLEKLSCEFPEEEWPYGERVEVRLKDGRVLEEEQIFVQGAAKRPFFMEDVIQKYHNCAIEAGLSEEKRQKILLMVKDLDQLTSISDLVGQYEGFLD